MELEIAELIKLFKKTWNRSELEMNIFLIVRIDEILNTKHTHQLLFTLYFINHSLVNWAKCLNTYHFAEIEFYSFELKAVIIMPKDKYCRGWSRTLIKATETGCICLVGLSKPPRANKTPCLIVTYSDTISAIKTRIVQQESQCRTIGVVWWWQKRNDSWNLHFKKY